MKLRISNRVSNILLIIICLLFIAAGTGVTVKVENLFVQFVGTCVALFSLYNTVIFLFYQRVLRNLSANFILPMTMTALSASDIQLKPDRHIPNMPMCDMRLIFIMSDHTERIRHAENIRFVKHDDGSTVGRMKLSLGRHGEFVTDQCSIAVRPVFSWWEFRYSIECRQKFHVSPKYSEDTYHVTHINFGDTDGTSHKAMQQSTDFFDNRKYYPGDDPRKINWKIFSHTGELQIRQSERTATNYGNQNIIFMPWTDDIEEYEQVTAVFVSICKSLLKDDIKLNILSPYHDKPINITTENQSRINAIINGSYKDFGYSITETEYQIIIGSPKQLCKILPSVRISDSLIISVNADNINAKKNSPLIIRKHDLMIRDIHSAKQEKIIFKSKQAIIEKLQELSDENKLVLY